MVPAAAQPTLRDAFRRYLDSRIEVYRKLPDIAAARVELDRTTNIQGEVWVQAVAACRLPDSHPSLPMALLPAACRLPESHPSLPMVAQFHPPAIVFVMLVLLMLVAALLTGLDGARAATRSWVHAVGFAAILSLTFYVIVDIEFPRLGFVRVDAVDRVLVELRTSMN
jgi:hypothetical protein